MANAMRRYKAEINGKEYVIIGPGSDSRLTAVTAIVNQQLAQIQRLDPDLSVEDAAVLLAFNTVSDSLRLKEEAADQETISKE